MELDDDEALLVDGGVTVQLAEFKGAWSERGGATFVSELTES